MNVFVLSVQLCVRAEKYPACSMVQTSAGCHASGWSSSTFLRSMLWLHAWQQGTASTRCHFLHFCHRRAAP